MNTNVGFLSDEPIENVITNLNFAMERTVFFGFSETIERQSAAVRAFLKEFCATEEVQFHPVSHTSLPDVLNVMQTVLDKEEKAGHQVWFDVTGGESLILVAFGILSRIRETPMHLYDVRKGILTELDEGSARSIRKEVPERKTELTLDRYVRLHGGVINYRMHKGMKDLSDPAAVNAVKALWEVSRKHGVKWNSFADFLRQCVGDDGSLFVRRKWSVVEREMKEKHTGVSRTDAEAILSDLAASGAVELHPSEEDLWFRFSDAEIRECIRDAGAVLELYTCLEERKNTPYCDVGVHLDWDGVIHSNHSEDVLNEIDVFSVRGYVPVFFSCKNGTASRMALYELEAVARRFGGRYAKAVMVAGQGMSVTDALRAREMGIEVISWRQETEELNND